jgi:hypothetical protein
MTDRRCNELPLRANLRAPRAKLCAAMAVLALCSGMALAQQPAPPPAGPPQGHVINPPAAGQVAPPQPAETQRKGGFLEEFGRWLEKSSADFNAGLKKSTDDFNENMRKAGRALTEFGDRAATAAKDATEAVSKLPRTRVVSGNERCELAPNGSPDCRAAAETICRGKGFSGGQSLDTQTAQKCPARVWISGRTPTAEECRLETFVTRAACQ